MSKDALAALRRELPSADLQGLDALKAAEAERLARLIDRARQQQKLQLNTALQNSLEHVPFLLRGAVRKVLFR
jgi:hypothetical protein